MTLKSPHRLKFTLANAMEANFPTKTSFIYLKKKMHSGHNYNAISVTNKVPYGKHITEQQSFIKNIQLVSIGDFPQI